MTIKRGFTFDAIDVSAKEEVVVEKKDTSLSLEDESSGFPRTFFAKRFRELQAEVRPGVVITKKWMAKHGLTMQEVVEWCQAKGWQFVTEELTGAVLIRKDDVGLAQMVDVTTFGSTIVQNVGLSMQNVATSIQAVGVESSKFNEAMQKVINSLKADVLREKGAVIASPLGGAKSELQHPPAPCTEYKPETAGRCMNCHKQPQDHPFEVLTDWMKRTSTKGRRRF